jgi:hypothetical protein
MVLAAAIVLGAGWLLAGAETQEAATAPESGSPAAASTTPLPEFEPSERLPAGSAVAFPTDI